MLEGSRCQLDRAVVLPYDMTRLVNLRQKQQQQERGEAKLIVSVSFGTQALLDWNCKSCQNIDANSCWLGHGDILVMDGQCQDEFLHCTDPGSEETTCCILSFSKDRCGVLFANVGVGFIRCCYGVGGNGLFFLVSGCSWELCACGRYLLCLFTQSCVQDSGYAGVPIAGHALGRRSVGALSGLLLSGTALWIICRQKQGETSFSPSSVFCVVEILGLGFGVLSCGIFVF